MYVYLQKLNSKLLNMSKIKINNAGKRSLNSIRSKIRDLYKSLNMH